MACIFTYHIHPYTATCTLTHTLLHILIHVSCRYIIYIYIHRIIESGLWSWDLLQGIRHHPVLDDCCDCVPQLEPWPSTKPLSYPRVDAGRPGILGLGSSENIFPQYKWELPGRKWTWAPKHIGKKGRFCDFSSWWMKNGKDEKGIVGYCRV